MYEKEKELVNYWLSLVGGDPDKVWESYKACMSDRLVWRLIGSTPISGAHEGLSSVLKDFFEKCWVGDHTNNKNQGLNPDYGIKPLKVNEVVALEDGRVMVHCFSDGVGNNQVPYENEYCWIISVDDGKITRVEEYADTSLIEQAIFNKRLVPASLA